MKQPIVFTKLDDRKFCIDVVEIKKVVEEQGCTFISCGSKTITYQVKETWNDVMMRINAALHQYKR
jgi:hypothetical protein